MEARALIRTTRLPVLRRAVFAFAVLFLAVPGLFAADEPGAVVLTPAVGAAIPFGVRSEATVYTPELPLYGPSFEASLAGSYVWPTLPALRPFGRSDYLLVPTETAQALNVFSLVAGVGTRFSLSPRISAGIRGGAGVYYAFVQGGTADTNPLARVSGHLSYALTPRMGMELGLSYVNLISREAGEVTSLYQGVGATVGVSIGLGGAHTPRIRVDEPRWQPVFPVLYGTYANAPLGTAQVANEEPGRITNVAISLYVPEYMDSSQLCARVREIAPGEQVAVPLTALFQASIMEVTEARHAACTVSVEYEYAGEQVRSQHSFTVRILDRNSVTWDDDRKAAAFVSARDPAVQRFARGVAGAVRDHRLAPVHGNFSQALALFEALRLRGLGYVVDPTTPYEELSADASAVDYLQFPQQTLRNGAGDCDDLSILYAALLQAVAVDAAFITVPGHIFVAFDSGLSQAEALRVFSNQDELILHGGRAWVPVETTLVRDGFLKAWMSGARQWRTHEAEFQAELIPVSLAWKEYEPVGIGVGDEAGAPPESERTLQAYEDTAGRFIAREIQPRVDELEERIRTTRDDRYVNRLGALYARFGLYDDALGHLARVTSRSSVRAIARVNMGHIYLLRGDAVRALSAYDEALNRDDSLAEAHVGATRALRALDRAADAAERFQIAVSLDPTCAERYPDLAGEPNQGRASSVRSPGDLAWLDEP